MRTLDRYIRNNVVSSILVVLLVIVAIESFLSFASELPDVGKGNYGFIQALEYVGMQLPFTTYLIFPMIGFVGSLVGMGRLSSSSELIVIRAAGVSIRRIIWSVIKASFPIILVMAVIGSWYGPELNAKADHLKLTAKLGTDNVSAMQNVWLRKGNDFINIQALPKPNSMQNVAIFSFNHKHQLTHSAYAKAATFNKDQWHLEDVDQTTFDSNAVHVVHHASENLNLNIDPNLISKLQSNSDGENVWQLYQNIHARLTLGLIANQYELTFWQRIIQPLTIVLMICLGIPFIFGSLRSASMGQRVMIGCIIGFVFYILNRIFGPIVIVYQVSPILGAALPTLFFILAYLVMARNVK